ncbi:MAG: PcfJ domain-containing protein [Oscillospiraceae bacterium]|nr:PcfJ domain-containing protein [Oscillospiraceae bacterium]
MLVKKELEAYPTLPFPKVKKDKYDRIAANATVADLEKSGLVLIVDFFDISTKEIGVRFATDGKNWQTARYSDGKVEWKRKNPSKLMSHHPVCTDEAMAAVKAIIPKHESYMCSGILRPIAGLCEHDGRQKRCRSWDNQEALRKQHFAMYPELPADLPEYCDRQVFEHGYLFLSKIRKDKKRDARCSECGANFEVDSKAAMGEIKPCPVCGTKVKNRGDWIKGGLLEKAQICVADKVDNQLLLRWVDIERDFTPELEKRYSFEPFAYNLYLNTPKGPKVYFYKWHYGPYGSNWWWRDKLGGFGYDSTFVYTRNLDEVFGHRYYNVDLRAGLEGKRSCLQFCCLLNSLRDHPAAEYLFKLGCPTMAVHAESVAKGKKPGFESMMGVSKQLLPLYRKFDVTPGEHRVIKAWGGWVSEEDFEAFRALKITDHHYAEELVPKMTFHRFVTYFTKQAAKHKNRKIGHLMMKYRDYLVMAGELGIDMSHKSVRYPADCIEAHDRVMKQHELVKNELDDKRFRENTAAIYEAIGNADFQKAGLCVVLPQSMTDFYLEGNALNHCVGSQSHYFENHMKGTQMIFFIREVSAPDKPYFTMEADMRSKTILQLYGFGDSSAPKEVRRFAEAFLKTIGQPAIEKAS